MRASGCSTMRARARREDDLVDESILAKSATVRILATSREGLGINRRATVDGALAGTFGAAIDSAQ